MKDLPQPDEDPQEDQDEEQEGGAIPQTPRRDRLLALTRAGSPASRRLASLRAARPTRAYDRNRNALGRQLDQGEGVCYRLRDQDDGWAIGTIMAMATTEQRRFLSWYYVRLADRAATGVHLSNHTDWQVLRNNTWWDSGHPNMLEPDAAN